MFPGVWNIQAGDVMLLLGLKDYVKKVQGCRLRRPTCQFTTPRGP